MADKPIEIPKSATASGPELVISGGQPTKVVGKLDDEQGIDVIIAGAGTESADLPNMTASIAYPLPVIGVPVQEKSLQSVIGMSQGAPIVAVDAGKSFNAALSATQILAREHEDLRDRLLEYHEQLKDEVGEVSTALHDMGTPGFKGR